MPPLLWNKNQPNLVLPSGDVHVWSAFVSEHTRLNDWHQTLSTEEVERALKFREKQAQQQFIVGRVAMRQILGSYLGLPSETIDFNRGVYGKLFLAPPLENEIAFNLSHAGDLVLMAFSRGRDLGIDIEKITPMPEAIAIANTFFSPEEVADVERQADPEDVFFRYWTRKEAALKCRGIGIDDDALRSPVPFEGVIRELQPAEGYSAALAVLGPAFALKTWHWTAALETKPSAYADAQV